MEPRMDAARKAATKEELPQRNARITRRINDVSSYLCVPCVLSWQKFCQKSKAFRESSADKRGSGHGNSCAEVTAGRGMAGSPRRGDRSGKKLRTARRAIPTMRADALRGTGSVGETPTDATGTVALPKDNQDSKASRRGRRTGTREARMLAEMFPHNELQRKQREESGLRWWGRKSSMTRKCILIP